MRKDIKIPKVKDVYVAAVLELNEDFNTHDWNVYLINDGREAIETVLIVAQGYDELDMTSPMRKTIKMVPANGYAKIEFIDESVFKLDNFFSITYFIDETMYDKRYELPRYSIVADNAVDLPVLLKKGILAR
ncbi:MAG: hypothetical protein ACI83B_000884 [Sediminicola sp.]|jgi:hypothetical protein|tara:strand:- start:29 stop:424 length:396 start_codon:yes stop_codon:yes gene_type:complete